MGSSYSSLCPPASRCEPALSSPSSSNNNSTSHRAAEMNTTAAAAATPPPKLGSTETIEQKMWRKVSKMPVVCTRAVCTYLKHWVCVMVVCDYTVKLFHVAVKEQETHSIVT